MLNKFKTVKSNYIKNISIILLLLFASSFSLLQACVPTVAITSSNLSVCTTVASCNFNATITYGGTVPTYQWYKNGVSLGLINSSATISNISNNDSIWCQLTSNDPCATPTIVTSNKIYVLFQPLTPTVSITMNPTSVCQGTMTTFSASVTSGGSAPSYAWKKNGVTVGNFANYATNSLINGDVIYCIITSNDPCVVSNIAASSTITVVLTTISAQAGLDKEICIGNYCNIGITPSAGLKYKWLPSTGLSYDNISNPRATPTATTTYALTVTNLAGTCTRKDSVKIVVDPLPKVYLGRDTTICFGKTLLLNAGAGFSSYWWNTSTTNQYYTVIAPYTYTVTVTDSNHCSGHDSILVNYEVCANGLNEITNSIGIEIYPNPAIDIIHFKGININYRNIEIYNIFGQKIESIVVENIGEETKINISQLSKGLYLLKTINADLTYSFTKFLKE
ncbi:MAG: hypothetical protein RI955_1166 [Bacteroidota bacterium]